jgi:hypothetical protein
LVVTHEAAAEDFEHEVEVVGLAGAVDDGESAKPKGRVHLAEVVAVAFATFDDDGRGGLGLTGEEFEEAGPGFLGGVGLVAGVEGEAQVDDGDVDAGGVEDGRGLAARAGTVGDDAHRLQEAGEMVDPGAGLPAGVGEEEVEAAGGGGSVRDAETGVVIGVWMSARTDHREGDRANGMPDRGSGLAREGVPFGGRAGSGGGSTVSGMGG